MDFSTENSEQKYLQLLQYIIENGRKKGNRTGTDTLSVLGATLRFPLYDGKNNKCVMPALTSKQVYVKTALKELLWFISGATNTKELVKQDVHIWDDNSTRKFLDSRGLKKYPPGELGPIYGYQWRTWNMIFEVEGTDEEAESIKFGSAQR
jgi:thymidylate synthase